MKLYKKGFSATEVLVAVAVFSLIGFVGWRAYELIRSNDGLDSATVQSSESEIPDGWVKYDNSEYGFSFAYPAEWGNVWVGEVSYGSEKKAGPHRQIYFADCEGCDPYTRSATPQIGITSKDFGGIGISRPLATAAGYTKNSDGSFTIDRQGYTENPDGSITIYRSSPKEITYTEDDTLELTLINEVLFVRYSGAPWHDADYTIAVANLSDGGEYSGISFVASDKVGETVSSDMLRSIVETYEAI